MYLFFFSSMLLCKIKFEVICSEKKDKFDEKLSFAFDLHEFKFEVLCSEKEISLMRGYLSPLICMYDPSAVSLYICFGIVFFTPILFNLLRCLISSQKYYVMQGAPPVQMGERYPHMFLILLLFHGAHAALKDPVQKWQTLGGKHLLVLFAVFFFNWKDCCFT